MELRQLRYFVAVAEELHFGRAAARVHIAQPPLSQQIKVMEDELGVVLFERTSRRVELTPAGRVLLDEAGRILAGVESAIEATRRASLGLKARLRVGFMGPAMDAFLAEAVGICRIGRPDIELVLSENGSVAQLAALESRQLDLAFIRHSGMNQPGIDQVVVFREPYCLAVPEGHPLAGRQLVSTADLDGQPFISFPRATGPALHDAIMAEFAAAGVRPVIVQEVTSKRSAAALASAGLGLALTPASSALWAHPGVTFRPLSGSFPVVEMAAAWRAGRLDAAAAYLVNVACELGQLA